jgi:DNA-binding response OmpR family regulator
MSTSTVLVVEDDPAIRRGLCDALKFAGYGVLECGEGDKATPLALESSIDLVLLDVMLPKKNGFEILRELRAVRPALPVIMVTARGAENDRVKGLTDGADDYVIKPFSAMELLARVDAVLRRSPERSVSPRDVKMLHVDSVTIDLQRREVMIADGPAHQLSDREVSILRFLAANRHRAVDRDELLRHVWGLNPRGLETRTVDMHIARLREKVGEHIIVTVRGKGYMLREGVKAE